jgi:DNA polymerase-1
VQHPIAAMQMNGLAIDVEAHRVLIDEWRVDLWNANEEVLKITGLSKLTPATLGGWLESVLDSDTLKKWPRTPGGKLAANKEVFNDFSHIEVIEPYAVFQKKKTLTGTFGAGLLDRINPATNRLHGSYDICGARTGRLSSREPNLQNLPRDSSVRSHFVASPGYTFICADYNQIELRVAAELSQDQAMLQAYLNDWDLHSVTASTVSGIPFDQFELLETTDPEYYDEQRRKAKAVNFGLLFGLGTGKFVSYAWQSYRVRFTEEEAHNIISAWRDLYSGYRVWQLSQASTASQTLEVRTPTGKLRRLPEDNTYGTSMNTPVQGGACEVMEYGLVELHKMLKFYPQAFIVNLVHDEILIECEDSLVDDVAPLLASCMRSGWKTVFPDGVITDKLVKVKTGANWQAAK